MILLVDDDETVRETSADMLEELGHTVLQAALDFAHSHRSELVAAVRHCA